MKQAKNHHAYDLMLNSKLWKAGALLEVSEKEAADLAAEGYEIVGAEAPKSSKKSESKGEN